MAKKDRKARKRKQPPDKYVGATRPHEKGTRFPTPEGTCFIMGDLPFGDGTYADGRNLHRFVVVGDEREYVDCVMAQTLYCDLPGEHKDRLYKLKAVPGAEEIKSICPPMAPAGTRRLYADLKDVVRIPKKVLFDSGDLRICCEGAENEPEPRIGMHDGIGRQRGVSEIRRLKNRIDDLDKDHMVRIRNPYGYHYGARRFDVSKYVESDALKELYDGAKSRAESRAVRTASGSRLARLFPETYGGQGPKGPGE